jgi:superoxide dismutase, Cu-Zn family
MANRAVAAVAAAVFLWGCESSLNVPIPLEYVWGGDLTPGEDWESLQGAAAFAWIEGRNSFRVQTEIHNDEPGAIRPWHLHHNTCAEGGGIVGQDAHYPRLEVLSGGSAGVLVDIPATIDPTASYHINVHLSDAEMDVIIMCGDMEFLGTF